MKKVETNLLEILAELEHQQWMNWAKDLMIRESLSEEITERWKSYFVLYKDLPESVKELDRNYARKVISVINSSDER